MSKRMQAYHHQQQGHVQFDELTEKYHPAYVNAFIEARHYPDQTIEEWTAAAGAAQFGSAQIYKPLSIGVSISGPSDNLFAVDCSKVDWHPRLVSAVKDALVSAGKANSGDSVMLMDVCGQEISAETSASGLQAAGVIYPAVKGTRILRSPLVGTEMQIQTPVSHQTNRESLLKSWIEDICRKSGTLIASALTDAKSASGVDDLLFGEGSKVKSAVVSLVQTSIPSIMEMFADPSKKQADIVQEISEKILGSVEKAYQARAEDLVSFFNHQEAKQRSPAIGKAIQQQQQQDTGKRSIFSVASMADKASAEKALIQSAISNKMEILYPNQTSLHRDILAGALGANGNLVTEIGHCVCNRVPSHRGHRGGGGARRRLRDMDHHRHHADSHHHRDGHGMQHHNEHRSSRSSQGQFSSATDHMASFKKMLGVDRYIEAIASKNALDGIPPSPGFAPIEGRHSSSSSSSKGMHGSHGKRNHSSEHYAKKRQPLTERVSSTEKMVREMPEVAKTRMATTMGAQVPVGRQMPLLEKDVPATFSAKQTSANVAPASRQMPSLGQSPVGRPMPSLETPPSRVAAAPIGRLMPSLEQSSAVPVPVAAALPVRSEGRIRHQPLPSSAPESRPLPHINI